MSQLQHKDLFEARIGLQIELRQRYDKRQESAAGLRHGESTSRGKLKRNAIRKAGTYIKTKCMGLTIDEDKIY